MILSINNDSETSCWQNAARRSVLCELFWLSTSFSLETHLQAIIIILATNVTISYRALAIRPPSSSIQSRCDILYCN